MSPATGSTGRNIVVGVAGGIAAYKACHVIRAYKEQGDLVRVIPTPNALRFVGAATFEALSGQPVDTDVFQRIDEVQHVSLGQNAEGIVIAPATADFIARIAAGRGDDLLAATVLVATCPVVIAPAMHTEMWLNPATQDNVATLRRRGITVLEPAHGRLTGPDTGPGRLLDPEQIVELANLAFSGPFPAHDWEGKNVLITAGGTKEPIDPVRYVGNHSSGKQGFALAEIAAQRGAAVTIVAGGTAALPTPAGATVVTVGSAQEMAAAVAEYAPQADVIIMAAAVADYRPATAAEHKLKKGSDDQSLQQLTLVENPDILATTVASRTRGELPKQPVIVGFAAETGNAASSVLDLAAEKLRRKGCDLLVTNDVSGGKTFGASTNQGWILRARAEEDPAVQEVPAGTKHFMAASILAAIDQVL